MEEVSGSDPSCHHGWMGAPPGPTSAWPAVTVGDPARHRAILQGSDEDLVLAKPRTVLATGTVNDIPWVIQGYVTAPGPAARWWHHGPIGAELEFLLGKDGSLGGGGAGTRIPDGTDFTCDVGFFGASPEVVSWVGVASERTDHLEVKLDDGSIRRVELYAGPEGFPRFFWFFPPRGAEGDVVAVDVGGAELQRERLLERGVPPEANTGTTVNPFSYAAGSPPPGWPEDATDYGPGEGPRWDEDFALHVAGFPIFVLPPEHWEGYAMLSGLGSIDRVVTRVRFAYLDQIPDPARALGVHCRLPDERWSRRRVAREEDIGTWVPGDSIANDELDLLGRVLPRAEFDSMILRPISDLGPRRCLGRATVQLVEGETSAERWEYKDYPNLRLVRMPLPEVEVTLVGWDIPDERLLWFASRLERLELGSDLLQRLGSAVAESHAAFGQAYDHLG
jgi:hypothetical protein